jgi:glycosyltransferase involved in cell wall biosynthesis
MKVVHVAESFSAGIIDFIFYLTTELKDYQHTIVYGKREIKERNVKLEDIKKRFPENTEFIEWKFARREINLFFDFLALLDLYKTLRHNRCDVVHLHSSKAGFVGRLLGSLFADKKILYTPNGAFFVRTDISNAKRKVVVLLEKFANKLSGQIVCCSASECRAFLDKNIKSSYINNGIVLSETKINSSTDGYFRIVTSGRASIQKNPVLFNKIAKALENEKKIKFIWIGDGDLRHELNASNIEVTGWIGKTEVMKNLEQADLYLSTALWEGLPFSVLEAMNYSKPLLLHNCVGNVDLVKNGYNGFIFSSLEEAAVKIINFSQHREQLVEMGKNSRQMCFENFNIKNTCRLYAEKYTEVTVEK